ncbi:hypothetical protein HMPREF2796_00915 [Eikenella sp. HMSC071B05]|nr:hypothetical protein HMPREF2796_00915 [Eikenella sp. HMSC071B05]OFO47953.1 hypothetical protein HMPREF3043_01410 [Eikenella sp. HMSC073A11]
MLNLRIALILIVLLIKRPRLYTISLIFYLQLEICLKKQKICCQMPKIGYQISIGAKYGRGY